MDRLACERMFVAVADAGSFARAATRLALSPAQASKLVARLEADLGTRLLDRTTRSLSLTDAGRGYLDRIKGLLDEFDALDSAMREATSEPTGRLRITAPLSYGSMRLTPALLALAETYPRITLDVSYSDRIVNLVEEGFDAAIRIGVPSDSALISRKLAEMTITVIASPAYLKGAATIASPADLAHHSCIIDSNFRNPLSWTFHDPDSGKAMSVAVSGRLHFSHAEACVEAACRGFGIARVPGFVAASAIAAGGVSVVLADYAPPPLPVNIVYPPGRYVSRKLRVFVDALVTHMAMPASRSNKSAGDT